jgi:HAMP domain-containing protein
LLEPTERNAVRASDAAHGDGFDVVSSHVFTWLRVPDTGEILAAALSWGAVAPSARRLTASFLLLGVLSLAVGMSLAELLARDAGHAIERLRGRAQRVSAGDLRGGVTHEGEDELGALGRDFDRMVAGLRALATEVGGRRTRPRLGRQNSAPCRSVETAGPRRSPSTRRALRRSARPSALPPSPSRRTSWAGRCRRWAPRSSS